MRSNCCPDRGHGQPASAAPCQSHERAWSRHFRRDTFAPRGCVRPASPTGRERPSRDCRADKDRVCWTSGTCDPRPRAQRAPSCGGGPRRALSSRLVLELSYLSTRPVPWAQLSAARAGAAAGAASRRCVGGRGLTGRVVEPRVVVPRAILARHSLQGSAECGPAAASMAKPRAWARLMPPVSR
jgi:hypothetical protein